MEDNKFKLLIKSRSLIWVQDGVVFEEVDRPSDNYFDTGLYEISGNACGSHIETSRLIVDFVEQIKGSSEVLRERGISEEQYMNISNYFNGLKSDDYTYWSILRYDEVIDDSFNRVPYLIMPKEKYVVLGESLNQLWVPYPTSEIVNEEGEELSLKDLKKEKLVSYSVRNCFSIIFMSDKQSDENAGTLDNIIAGFCEVLSSNGIPAAQCSDLYELYLSLKK